MTNQAYQNAPTRQQEPDPTGQQYIFPEGSRSYWSKSTICPRYELEVCPPKRGRRSERAKVKHATKPSCRGPAKVYAALRQAVGGTASTRRTRGGYILRVSRMQLCRRSITPRCSHVRGVSGSLRTVRCSSRSRARILGSLSQPGFQFLDFFFLKGCGNGFV